jgi:hypothetical protein
MTSSLYRATYQAAAKDGGKIRRMTFAAPDTPGAAQVVAENWRIDDQLLTVKRIRPLKPQKEFTLTTQRNRKGK